MNTVAGVHTYERIPSVGEHTSTELARDMKGTYLKSLSVGELWELHEQIVAELNRKITTEKATLEERLHRLGRTTASTSRRHKRAKRPYPKVLAKYRNPNNRGETWAGRGKQPRWLVAELRSGKKLEDFQIRRA